MKKCAIFIFICAFGTIIAMEPPSEKKRKQEITEDIVPTPAKKTKLEQAMEGEFTLFVELPEEMQQYIVFQNASTFEQAIKNIQGMMQTNTKWRNTINDNVDYIITLLAHRFNVSELLVAFYLNTNAAQDFIDDRFDAHGENMTVLLNFAFQEAIQRFDNSVRSQKVVQAILATGANFQTNILREKDGTFLYATDYATDKFIKKINSDGSDDSSFSVPLPTGIDYVRQLIRGADNSLYILAYNLQHNSILVKYLANGTVDKNFGENGILLFTTNIITALALSDKSGNIITVGENKAFRKAIIGIYNSSGKMLHEVMNFSTNSRYTNCYVTPSGSIFALGFRLSDEDFEKNIITQEFTQNLQAKQTKYEEIETDDVETKLLYEQPNGNIIIAGTYYTPEDENEYRLVIMWFDKTLKKLGEFTTEMEEL